MPHFRGLLIARPVIGASWACWMKTGKTIAIVVLVSGLLSCGASSVVSYGLVNTYTQCADGWPSPSIGHMGACSHHGGVVEHTTDDRSDVQKYSCYVLDVLGILLLLSAPIVLAAASRIPPIPITGESATVPLTIGNECRMVLVVRRNNVLYETSEDVALVKCPEGRRSTVYRSTIKFEGSDGTFQQNLSTWIHTGRGRNGGYYARAFGWSKSAPPAQPPHA